MTKGFHGSLADHRIVVLSKVVLGGLVDTRRAAHDAFGSRAGSCERDSCPLGDEAQNRDNLPKGWG